MYCRILMPYAVPCCSALLRTALLYRAAALSWVCRVASCRVEIVPCRGRVVSKSCRFVAASCRVEIVPCRGHVVWMSVMSSHASHNKLKLLLLLTLYRAPVPNSLDLLTRQSFVIDLQACHPSFVKL